MFKNSSAFFSKPVANDKDGGSKKYNPEEAFDPFPEYMPEPLPTPESEIQQRDRATQIEAIRQGENIVIKADPIVGIELDPFLDSDICNKVSQ